MRIEPRAGARALPAVRRDTAVAVVLALLVIAYGNLISLRPDEVRIDYVWAFILGNLMFVGLLLVWLTRIEGLPLAAVGLASENAGRSALAGALLALVAITPVVLFFAVSAAAGSGVSYQDIDDTSWGGFFLWAGLKQPVGTSFFEELLFRGILLAKMTVAWGQRRALLASGAVFALWHLVISFRTIQDTNVASPAGLALVAILASLAGIFVGALFLGYLRQRTGNLAGSMVFHWLVVVAMNGTLFLMSR